MITPSGKTDLVMSFIHRAHIDRISHSAIPVVEEK